MLTGIPFKHVHEFPEFDILPKVTVDLQNADLLRSTLSLINSKAEGFVLGLEVPLETTEDLLDLLCFYNSEDPPENSLVDELFFHRDVSQDNSRKMIRKEWK